MSSNYKDIPIAVDNVYKFVNSDLDVGFKYNDFGDFTRYSVDSEDKVGFAEVENINNISKTYLDKLDKSTKHQS